MTEPCMISSRESDNKISSILYQSAMKKQRHICSLVINFILKEGNMPKVEVIKTGKYDKHHLQQGIPAPISTSGVMTVVFSPRSAKVTAMNQTKYANG